MVNFAAVWANSGYKNSKLNFVFDPPSKLVLKDLLPCSQSARWAIGTIKIQSGVSGINLPPTKAPNLKTKFFLGVENA